VKAVREEEVELRGIGFVKQVGFKSGVREGVMDEQSGETEEEVVIGEVPVVGESDMQELVRE